MKWEGSNMELETLLWLLAFGLIAVNDTIRLIREFRKDKKNEKDKTVS